MAKARSIERPAGAIASEAFASVAAAWGHLRACLEYQSAALSAEVRAYPTPIAGCDEQLTELLARRSRVIERLKRLEGAQPVPPGNTPSPWRTGLTEYLELDESAIDDEPELALRARLKEALDRLAG